LPVAAMFVNESGRNKWVQLWGQITRDIFKDYNCDVKQIDIFYWNFIHLLWTVLNEIWPFSLIVKSQHLIHFNLTWIA
jgi:hypothetical protein